MVGGGPGSVGSYSSGSSHPGENVLVKYGSSDTGGKIAKMEKDITSAEKDAKQKQKSLEQTVAANKAEDIAKLKGGDSSKDKESDNGSEAASAVDDNGAPTGNVKNITEELTKRVPEEVFAQFDTDGSGYIDFDEFRAMLPHVGIKISMPKALKYFRMCDTDGSGEVDFDEFKVALFAFDPDNGNPVGFTPNALLAPLDAFEMFDEDNSGRIDEDEFFFLLQFLGLEVSEIKQEQLFAKYDTDKSGYIDYSEFKKIWVRLANVKKELTDRGVKISKLATNRALFNMLEQILDTEEDREHRAIAEAERWATWQLLLKDKKRAYEKARRRTMTELKSALDAGGSVWVFGTGPFGEFTAPAPKVLKQGRHEFAHYDVIRSEDNITSAGEDKASVGEAGNDMSTTENINHMDPEEDARTSPFAHLCVAQSTAALWGRRIVSVTTSDSAAFAVSALGEGYAWGGKDHWWFEIRPDSHWQTHWRGDTTERSRLLLQTVDKEESDEIEPEEEENEQEKEFEKLMVITQYYGVWKPPPTNKRLSYVNRELLPKIKHQQVKYSLQCRGKHVEDMNKADLVDLLHDDIILEKKVLGERQHRRIRQLELETLNMSEKGKNLMAKALRLEIEDMWTPLREIQAEDSALMRANREAFLGIEYARAEEEYSQWREHIQKAREEANPVFTPRGNSLELELGGVTERAGIMQTPRANAAAVAVLAGANHVLLVHRSGQLYTWGVGASGRLGLDLSQGGNPQADTAAATVIQAFSGRPVIRASAGYNHSAAITTSGRVYTWGSAATGKLGLGTVALDVYCSVPTRMMVNSPSKVKEISCGAAHTACVTAAGELFVWGCGDGGRLGLGEERLGTQYEPILVEAFSLAGERIGSVSCGNSHTLVLTQLREVAEGEGKGRHKTRRGGKMYQAGSTNVLGTFCPAFTPLEGLEDKTVKQVSAGYGHSCCSTTEGELYTWGSNRDGCLGLPRIIKFANSPQLVSCLYMSPKNLAWGRPSRQSSVYDGLTAAVAVDGDCSGDNYQKCNCTQQDPQGWWEVDLGQLTHVHQVKVWNRCDGPSDPSMEHNFYAKRLFPCWVLASQEPFKEDVGGAALLDAMNSSVARCHFTEEQRCSVWRCPKQTMARYVRVQLEGFDFLHMAQVEVYGTLGGRRSPGMVTQCWAGKYVTTVVIAAAEDPADAEIAYKKAVQADAFNAEVLRQLENFFSAYEEWGRGDAFKGCLLCKAGSLCEICAMKHEFREELRELPLGPGGSVQSLSSIAHYLFDQEKPNLNYASPVKKGTGIINSVRGKMTQLLGPLQSSSETKESESRSTSKNIFGRGSGSRSAGKKGNIDQIASEDGTLSSGGHSGSAYTIKDRADEEYHVGSVAGSLSSNESSSSSAISTTSSAGSLMHKSDTNAGGGGNSTTTSNTSGSVGNSGGSTDRSGETTSSAAGSSVTGASGSLSNSGTSSNKMEARPTARLPPNNVARKSSKKAPTGGKAKKKRLRVSAIE